MTNPLINPDWHLSQLTCPLLAKTDEVMAVPGAGTSRSLGSQWLPITKRPEFKDLPPTMQLALARMNALERERRIEAMEREAQR